MAEMPKSRVMILAVMALIFFATTAMLYVFLNAERTKRESVEKQLSQTIIEKENVERDLEETIKVKVNLETQVKETETKLESISKELENEKQEKEGMVSQLSKSKSEAESLRTQLENEKRSRLVLTTEKARFSEELNNAKKNFETVKTQMEQLRKAKDALEAKVAEMLAKQQAQLDKIVVTPKEAEGKVLVVNKEFGFVVINLGEKDGAKVGTVFDVSRANKPVGRVQVDKVYPTMSGATILPDTKGAIKQDDTVKAIF